MRYAKTRRLQLLALLLALGLTVSAAGPAAGDEASPAPIGRVKTVSGHASITTGEHPRTAVVGAPIYLRDIVETPGDGSLGIVFADESRLALGPDTRLTVDEYVYSPEATTGSFVTRMLRGSLLYVSGLIAKLAPESVRVETPAGTVGIRGTRFLLTLVRETE